MSASIPLSQLPRDQWANVQRLAPQAEFGDRAADVMQRLMELGFLPGSRVRVVGFGFLGRDPIAVQVNGTKFALRHQEASHIWVQPTESGV